MASYQSIIFERTTLGLKSKFIKMQTTIVRQVFWFVHQITYMHFHTKDQFLDDNKHNRHNKNALLTNIYFNKLIIINNIYIQVEISFSYSLTQNGVF